jgi:hypothetical protein
LKPPSATPSKWSNRQSDFQHSAYATSWYPEYDYWRPIPALTPPENSTLTILFITSLHIFYLDFSADPIFGADEKYLFDDGSKPWWYKSDPRSRPLACIDSTEVCEPDGISCWSMTEARDGLPPSYWLMKLSLEASNMYDAIVNRLGSALIAQELVSQSGSTGLADNHWQFEAARLFATSLARIQFEAWSIATAEGMGEEGYISETPDEAGDMCGLFKIRASGYKNLAKWPFVALWFVFPLFMFLGQEVKDVVALWRKVQGIVQRRQMPPGAPHANHAPQNDGDGEAVAPPCDGENFTNPWNQEGASDNGHGSGNPAQEDQGGEDGSPQVPAGDDGVDRGILRLVPEEYDDILVVYYLLYLPAKGVAYFVSRSRETGSVDEHNTV